MDYRIKMDLSTNQPMYDFLCIKSYITCMHRKTYNMSLTKILVISLSLEGGWISDDFYSLCYTF